MKILMLSTVPGSVDGIRVASFEADQEYDLTATEGARALAAAFVGAGLANEVGQPPAVSAPTAAESDVAPGGEGAAAAPPRQTRRAKAQ